MSTPTTIAARELRHLARVGAYRYLDAAYDVLEVRAGVELPALDSDTGLVPCDCARCLHGPGEKHRGHDVSAFKVHAEAERTTLAALAKLTDEDDVTPIVQALKLGLEESDRVRHQLRNLQPIQFALVPGRGSWLLTPQNAERLAMQRARRARTARPGVPGAPDASKAPAGVVVPGIGSLGVIA